MKKTIKTPLGVVEVGPGRTPSSDATVTIFEMRGEIKKIAQSGTVSVEKLRENESQSFYIAE